MTNSLKRPDSPTAKQLRYLRDLAASRGQTFTYPHTAREASAEIDRLRAIRPISPFERRRSALQASRDIAERLPTATAVRPDEIEGYGSSARWR